MEIKNKIETLQFIIDRYDHYYDAVNNKGNVYLTLMTFLLGGSITVFYNVTEKHPCNNWAWAFFIIILLIQLLGIILTLASIKPFLKSVKKKPAGSVIYFGDVASYTIKEYKKIFDERDLESMYEDALKQVHQLATGLKKKYCFLNWSTYIIGIQIILISVMGIIITH